MNSLCFNEKLEKIDGNFISIYNSQTERYHYFCHRLLSINLNLLSLIFTFSYRNRKFSLTLLGKNVVAFRR